MNESKLGEIGVNYELVGLVWCDWLSTQLEMRWLWTIGSYMNFGIFKVKHINVQRHRRTWIFPKNWCAA